MTLAAAGFVAGVSSAMAEPALEIRKEVVVEKGNGARPRAVLASTDGGAVVVGERGSAQGPQLWIAKFGRELNASWRLVIDAGTPNPSQYSADAAFEAPDGSIMVLAHRIAFSKVDSQIIRIDKTGALSWIRPFECKSIECRVDILHRAIALPDGLILMRGVVLPPTEGTHRGRPAGLLQKITWDAKLMWQQTDFDRQGLASRVEVLGSRFVFAEIGVGGTVSVRSFDESGRFGPRIRLDVTCSSQGSFLAAGNEFVLYCPTDVYPATNSVLGGRLVLLDDNFRVTGDRSIESISSVVFANTAGKNLVLIGGARNEVGGRSFAAATVVDSASGRAEQTLFLQYRNPGSIQAATRASAVGEFLLIYQANEGRGMPDSSLAVVSLVRVRH